MGNESPPRPAHERTPIGRRNRRMRPTTPQMNERKRINGRKNEWTENEKNELFTLYAAQEECEGRTYFTYSYIRSPLNYVTEMVSL